MSRILSMDIVERFCNAAFPTSRFAIVAGQLSLHLFNEKNQGNQCDNGDDEILNKEHKLAKVKNSGQKKGVSLFCSYHCLRCAVQISGDAWNYANVHFK